MIMKNIKLQDMTKVSNYHYIKELSTEFRLEIKKFKTWRVELYKKRKDSERIIWVCDGYDSDSKNKKSVTPGKVLWQDVNKIVEQYV